MGLACFFCGDKCNDMETYESHVKVCEMRWTRIESRKPSASRRRKPIRRHRIRIIRRRAISIWVRYVRP